MIFVWASTPRPAKEPSPKKVIGDFQKLYSKGNKHDESGNSEDIKLLRSYLALAYGHVGGDPTGV